MLMTLVLNVFSHLSGLKSHMLVIQEINHILVTLEVNVFCLNHRV